MTSLVQRVLGKVSPPEERGIYTVDDYMSTLNDVDFYYGGNLYTLGNTPGLVDTWGHEAVEEAPSDLEGYAQAAYASSGVVFACLAVRMAVFSQIRFQWQQYREGIPSKTFGTPALKLLEQPWVGGTTQDFLASAILDADLAGNSYWARDYLTNELVRLRPDWVRIILEPRYMNGGIVGYRKIGYVYWEGGKNSGTDPVPFLPEQVLHFYPRPDPLARYRGVSWLQSVIREIQGDKLMGKHKIKFFENAACPNLSVSLDKEVRRDQFEKFVKMMEMSHRGVDQAYKTLYLGGGADVRVIGANFEQMDFKRVQGHGETRIAAAAGIPPIIVGLSEGLDASTYSNYGQARRHFADMTLHALWQNIAGSAQRIVPMPERSDGVELSFSTRDVPFLREDRKDAADIQGAEASTINTLITAGFTPESAVAAVSAQDWGLLVHSGLTSVQLQPPGAQLTTPGTDSAPAVKNGNRALVGGTAHA